MKYNWLRDKELQHLIRLFWDSGKNNDADYFTKDHPPSYHQNIRERYILKGYNVTSFPSQFFPFPRSRVCWNPSTYPSTMIRTRSHIHMGTVRPLPK